MRTRTRKVLTSLVCLILFACPTAQSRATEVAVIVNKENVLDGLSSRELERICAQEKRFWGQGGQIYLLLRESGSREKEILLKKVYRMSEEDLKKLWLTKLFQQKITSFPMTLGSDESAKRFVSRIPHAIGFIDAAAIDETVKVLAIDGRSPGDKEYTLTDNSPDNED